MILVDRELERREAEGKPIRVAMIGAGFMGRGIALQIEAATPGMTLVAIANRTLDRAQEAYRLAGVDEPVEAATANDLGKALRAGGPAVTTDPLLLAEAEGVDALIEVTGSVEPAARVVARAIECGKHAILMNAELDGTVGPALKARADRRGVVYTNADGDQPGVTMNLYRFVRGIGVRPVLCGNIKGLHDPYRNPTTQQGFAERWGQNPTMVTSFADGTKISFEQAIVANATGMRVARRGMHGPAVEPGTPVEEAAKLFDPDELREGPGIVDYVVGASPGPGVFVLGTHENPVQRHYLELYKLGEGPLYCFTTPYHLCHFEVPTTVARAVCFGDATLAPSGGIRVEVVAAAKLDLSPGDELDGPGGYLTYGLAENVEVASLERLLPMGLAEGCTVTRPVAKDAVLTFEDAEVPGGRFVDGLRAEQNELFG